MKINVTSERGGSYRLKISSPDREAFFSAIESLKNYIAPYHREYDGVARQWVIDGAADFYSWLDVVEQDYAAEVIWGNAKKQQTARKPPSPSTDELYAALHLLPTAPPELVKSAYRLLASLNHPDHGGDELAMKRLNLIYEKLKAA
jgi:hypothetical protein